MGEQTTTQCSNGEPCRLTYHIHSLEKQIAQLSELVHTDPLTQLYNYRHFSQNLHQEIERSLRSSQPTSIIMIDVDYFKKVNDDWGHEVGNIALTFIAKSIVENVRKLDIACRYGGEEFGIILPTTDVVTGAKVAERIRCSIEQHPLVFGDDNGNEQILPMTVSAGLSTLTGKTFIDPKKLVSEADSQLYLAKQQGRNQVCFTHPSPLEQQVNADEKAALADAFKHKID